MRRQLNQSELILSSKNLAKKSLHGGLYLLIGQFLSFLIMMSSTAILARLLQPKDYGLIAIAIAIVVFFNLFKDFGLSISLIQKQKINNEDVVSAFWFTIFIGLFLTFLLSFLSYPISIFFHDKRLISILIIISLTFFIGSFSIVPNAILRRNMKFKQIMYIQTFSSFLTVTIAIYLAYNNYGYWALVFNIVSPIVITTILTLYLLNWFPLFYFSIYNVKKYIKVSKYIMYFDIINYFSRNLDNILIGKFYSTTSLGYYSKAYQLLLLPIQQIRIPLVNVALPALSSVEKDKEVFDYYYYLFSEILNILIIPIVCLMWLNANEIIWIVLGEKWLYSAEMFKLLAFVALIQPIMGTFGLILIALNETKKYFQWGVLNFLLIITGFMIGINYNLIVFIEIYVVLNYISFIFSIYFIFKLTSLNIILFLKTLLIPMIYFMPTAYFINTFIIVNNDLNLINFFVKTILFFIFVVIFFYLFPNYKNKLFNIKAIFKQKG